MSFFCLINELDGALRGASGRKVKLSGDEIELTTSFLECYPVLQKTVNDYEATGAHLIKSTESAGKSLLAYAALKNGGNDRYRSYKTLLEFIQEVINNLHNPYERKVMQLLYIDGLKFTEARAVMRDEPDEGLNPIYDRTFAERRKRALNRITLSFKIIGILDILPEELINLKKEIGLTIMHRGWHRQEES